jgi:hypothetical protein
MVARLGVQIELAQKTLLTRIIHRAKIYDILGWIAVSDLSLVGNLKIYSRL